MKRLIHISCLLQRKRTALKSESDGTGVNASGSDGVMATPVDELKKRLKDASDSFPPTAPSLRIYSIDTHGNQRYLFILCMPLFTVFVNLCMYITHTHARVIKCCYVCFIVVLCSITSSCFHGETFVCGFDNSSIHTWHNNNKATTVTNKYIQTNKSYSYLSLDDYDSDNHSGISVDRK